MHFFITNFDIFLFTFYHFFKMFDLFMNRFCKCGRPKSDHSKDAINNANAQWNIKKHIKSCKTNAYGEVEFHGTNRKTRAKVNT